MVNNFIEVPENYQVLSVLMNFILLLIWP